MIFGPNHYVPVLKAKRGEKKALLGVAASLRPRITPLLEVVVRNPDKAATLSGHLDTAFKDLVDAVAGYQRCMLDARELAPDGPQAAQDVFARAASAGIRFTPVTGISRAADVGAALAHNANGVAIRLTRREFEDGVIPRRLPAFMAQHNLIHAAVDLIVDVGAADDMVAEGIQGLTRAFLDEVPDHGKWRTLTVSACSFPASMGGVERHSHEHVERAEWRAWHDGLYGGWSALKRLPTYSDCGIQHPAGVEGFDPRIMPMSAAVRYTRGSKWLLIKGESVRSVPSREQYLGLATRLVYGNLRSDFDGPAHCAGCAAIKDAANGLPRYGSAEAWRRLGTIHHITTVVQALAALTWP